MSSNPTRALPAGFEDPQDADLDQPRQRAGLPAGFVDPQDAAPAEQPQERGILRRTADFFTGSTPMEFPDRKEITEQTFRRGTARLLGIFATSLREEDQVKGVQNTFPGTEAAQDKFGHLMVKIPRKFLAENQKEQWVYINRPGFSTQDAFQASAQIAAFAPGTAVAARAPSLLSRATAAAPLAAATSVAQDVTATALGTEQGIDPERAAIAGLFGGAAEFLGPAFARARDGIARMFSTRPNLIVNGQLTDQGKVLVRQQLQRSGMSADDLAQVSDDTLNRLAADFQRLQSGGQQRVGEIVRQAEAESLPVPVRQTRGQITQNPRIQMAEDLAEKGVLGEIPRDITAGARAQADDQLRANIPAIQSRLTGSPPRQRGQGPAEVSQTLSAQDDALRVAENRAFDVARQSGAGAGVPAESVQGLAQKVQRQVLFGHDLSDLPKIQSLLSSLDDLGRSTSQEGDRAVLVNEIFRVRAQASAARGGGGEQAVAAGKIVREIDAFSDDVLDDALLAGDDQAISLWRQAIGKARERRQIFKSNDLIEALAQREARGGQWALKVDPADAANYIFGRSSLGFVGKQNLTRDLERLRQVLGGADSSGWNAIREEVFLRVVNRGLKGLASGESRVFNGAAVRDDWLRLTREDGKLVSLLFNESERNLIGQFTNVAQRTTSPVKGGANFSNTTPALANLGSRLLDATFLGPKGQALLSRIPGLSSVIEVSVQAPRAAVNVGGGITPSRSPLGTAATTAAGASQEQ